MSNPYQTSTIMRTVLGLAQHLRCGSLTVILPDGRRRQFQGRDPGPAALIQVHRDRVARRMVFGGVLGFCESYLDGDWSSPDRRALFELGLLNEQALAPVWLGGRWSRWMHGAMHWWRRNTRNGSQRNIAYHYDLGNAFYQRWLDPGMTYSSAVFADPEAPECLEAAQDRKYAELARRLALGPEQTVLEIGCGWGGFATFAARDVGARVTAITISREQYDFASRRIQAEGLGERAEIRLQDYRDVQGTFDRLASIEMFEAVGEAYWPTFFAALRDRLVAGGRAALQVITIADRLFEDYRNTPDYIQKYIFPGGMLPSVEVLRKQVAAAGLAWHEAASYGRHYARTLAHWQDRFQAAWPDIAALGFDDRFKRMWEQYLTYCEAGFTVGTIDVKQIALQKG